MMSCFKRTQICFLCLVLSLFMIGGCSKNVQKPDEDSALSVYATFYPFYAAAQLVLEDVPDINLNCLVQPQDGCLRNYQLSDWDAALLKSSDFVIAGGCGLESFEQSLYSLGEEGPAVASVLYGMQLAEQRGLNTDDDAQSHWLDPNPHIYMQMDGMIEIANRICDAMVMLDPEESAAYQKNLENAECRLQNLKAELTAELAFAENEKVIVMNEALVYTAMDYNLEIALCYDRESGEDLIGSDLESCLSALKKCDAKLILIEKQAPEGLCSAFREAGFRLALLDVMSTRRASEGAEGFFEAHRANALELKAALM